MVFPVPDAGAETSKPGGSIVVLDLLKHDFEAARELYADVWLGFAEVDISDFLDQAGFKNIDIAIAVEIGGKPVSI